MICENEEAPLSILWILGCLTLFFEVTAALELGYQTTYLLLFPLIPAIVFLLQRWPRRFGFLFFLPFLSPWLWRNTILSNWIFVSVAILQAGWAYGVAQKKSLQTGIVVGLVSVVFWCVGAKLFWWKGDWINWFIASPWNLGVFFSSFFLIHAAMSGIPELGNVATHWIRRGVTAAAVVLFGLASTRVSFHTDSECIVGAIQLVKEGGFLLWDVPSQYGFLSILTAASVPVSNPYFAMYLMNSFLLLISSLILFWIASRYFKGILGIVCATLLTFVVVFLSPGWIPDLLGVNLLPSVGAFRFIWCYALVGTAFYSTQVLSGTQDSRRGVHRLGRLFWLMGCFWSFESAVCTSVIWGAYLLGLALESQNWKGLLIEIGILTGWYLGGWALIAIAYLALSGHLPDPRCFFEYAIAYGGAYGGEEIDSAGPVLFLIALLALPIFHVFTGKRLGSPLLMAALGLIWSTSSYFVMRRHSNQVSNLMPLLTLGILAVAASREGLRSPVAARLFIGMLFTVNLAITIGNSEKIRDYLESLVGPRRVVDMKQEIGVFDEEGEQSLLMAGVGETEPVLLLQNRLIPRGGSNTLRKQWLPFAPATQIGVLSPERQVVYIERFLNRKRISGWLLYPVEWETDPSSLPSAGSHPLYSPELIFHSIASTHRKSSEQELSGWKLLHFEPLSQ